MAEFRVLVITFFNLKRAKGTCGIGCRGYKMEGFISNSFSFPGLLLDAGYS